MSSMKALQVIKGKAKAVARSVKMPVQKYKKGNHEGAVACLLYTSDAADE